MLISFLIISYLIISSLSSNFLLLLIYPRRQRGRYFFAHNTLITFLSISLQQILEELARELNRYCLGSEVTEI